MTLALVILLLLLLLGGVPAYKGYDASRTDPSQYKLTEGR